MNDDFPHDSRVEFDEDELMRLLRANPMRHLEKMDANITLKERTTFDGASNNRERELSIKDEIQIISSHAPFAHKLSSFDMRRFGYLHCSTVRSNQLQTLPRTGHSDGQGAD